MAKGERAFWSSLPGVLTGLAGILTAGFGLVGLSVSQGWIGEGGIGTDARISVEPESLKFEKLPAQGARAATVEVLNDGPGPITLATEVTGDDANDFRSTIPIVRRAPCQRVVAVR